MITAKHTTRTVSIHAPTRGATSSSHCSWSMRLCFNPRTHTGCDTAIQGHTYSISEFQSTHPHGVRHRRGTRRGLGTRVSIHAPTRGATTLAVQQLHVGVVSIHAPTRGATCPSEIARLLTQVSIHAPTRGATDGRWSIDRRGKVSIHAPTRGATTAKKSLLPQSLFQSTHPHGVRHTCYSISFT